MGSPAIRSQLEVQQYKPRATARNGTRRNGAKPEDDVVGLLRALVARVADADRDRGAEVHVLLDIEVDGVRCILAREPAETDERANQTVALSPREREIARMVAEGYPNKTIAAVLDISSWTVSTHLRRIFAKVGVRTRAAMVARVLEDGLMEQRGDEPYYRST
jgi:DNA-binding CsgD family transcriptional regulator